MDTVEKMTSIMKLSSQKKSISIHIMNKYQQLVNAKSCVY